MFLYFQLNFAFEDTYMIELLELSPLWNSLDIPDGPGVLSFQLPEADA